MQPTPSQPKAHRRVSEEEFENLKLEVKLLPDDKTQFIVHVDDQQYGVTMPNPVTVDGLRTAMGTLEFMLVNAPGV